MINVKKIDHVAIAVWSIPEALKLFRDLLGGKFIVGGDDERLGIRTLQLCLPPGVKIELMQPLRVDSYLQLYLEERGEGFHHMTIIVENLEKAIKEFQEQGFEVVGTDLSQAEWRETFLRPKFGFGTLLQVVDTIINWDIPLSGIKEEDVLAGRVIWQNGLFHLRGDD